MFKSLIPAVVIASALAAPAVSFAQQSNAPVTRAQVQGELVQLEKAGYQPSRANNLYYPADIQAAEARVAAQNGGTVSASTSGAPASAVAMRPTYAGG
jgi:hypothetical protein